MTKRSAKVNFPLHKTVIIVFLLPFILSTASVKCRADETDGAADVRDSIDSVIDDFNSALPEGYEPPDSISEVSESLGIKHILEGIVAEIKGNGTEITAFLTTLLGIALLNALASLGDSEMGVFASRAVGAVTAALLFDRLAFLTVGAVRSLEEIGEFFSAVIPVCLAVNSLGVSPTTATTQALGMGVTLSVYSTILKKLILPLVGTVFVTAAASSFDGIFEKISRGIKNTFLWCIGIFTALVGATFSLQTVISASADNAAIRSARYAISGTIPIVGGAVSGALSVLSGGVAYARGIVGGGAIAVMLSLILSPLVTLLLYRLCLKLGVFFTSVSLSGGCAQVLTSFLGAIEVLIAAYSLSAAIYVAELVAFMKGGASFA